MEGKCKCDYEERRCGWCKGLESRLAAFEELMDKNAMEAGQRIAELEQENARLREYVDLTSDAIAWLIIRAGFPSLEAMFYDAEKLERAKQLKSELYDSVR